jgi:hypothetical protein
MKIAISELTQPKTDLCDLESIQGAEIIGGAAEVGIFTESFAEGDFAITKSDANVYSFKYKTKAGVYDVSFGFGFALAASFTANPA